MLWAAVASARGGRSSADKNPSGIPSDSEVAAAPAGPMSIRLPFGIGTLLRSHETAGSNVIESTLQVRRLRRIRVKLEVAPNIALRVSRLSLREGDVRK